MGSQSECTPVSGKSTEGNHLTTALDEKVPLYAKPTRTSAKPSDIEFTKYVPYQLQLYISGLFPEFYFHFKKNFSKESAENAAYCNLSLGEFSASYTGSEKNISNSVEHVEADFAMKFRQCLHPDLRQEFPGWTFNRDRVETQFREKLERRKDLVSKSLRLDILSKQAQNHWRVEPLVDFLTAFGYSEETIWTLLIQVLGSSAVGDRSNRRALNEAADLKSGPGTLASRAQAFADSYKAATRHSVASGQRTVSTQKIVLGLVFTFSVAFCGASVLFWSTMSFEELFLSLLLIFVAACALLFVWYIAIQILDLNA